MSGGRDDLGVFVLHQEAVEVAAGLGAGASARPGRMGSAWISTKESADSEQAWRFDDSQTIDWQCSQVADGGVGCAKGAHLNITTRGDMGTVHRMKDGHLYLEGFDCLTPDPYEGEPLAR